MSVPCFGVTLGGRSCTSRNDRRAMAWAARWYASDDPGRPGDYGVALEPTSRDYVAREGDTFAGDPLAPGVLVRWDASAQTHYPAGLLCAQCGVAEFEHPAGDGLSSCPGDFGTTTMTALDRAVIAYREHPSVATRSALLAAQRVHVDRFYGARANEYRARTA